MKKTIAFVCVAISGIAAGVVAAEGTPAAAPAAAPAPAQQSCGQMMADKSVLPSKMAEVMTAVSDMLDAHVAFMAGDKSKEAKAEMEGLKKISKEHRTLAAQFTKAAETMKGAAKWTAVPHDPAKMMADPKIKESMAKMLTTHKDMLALLQKEVAMMESMQAPKTN